MSTSSSSSSFPASHPLVSTLPIWQTLTTHASSTSIQGEQAHLRHLLQDESRSKQMMVEYDNILLDYSRQRVTPQTMELLFELAESTQVREQITNLRLGKNVNVTENRAVMHLALRSSLNDQYFVDGKNVVPDVHQVLNQIKTFAQAVRSNQFTGSTGKPLKNVIAIGIGGSYLGANFVSESLKHDNEALQQSKNRELRFLANVDPVAVSRAIENLNPEETLAIIISKTFTTRETMLNARTIKQWFIKALGSNNCIQKHMVAVSTNIKDCMEFGIDQNNIFQFWDWVGGRYSVTSAVGLLPLALHFSYPVVEKFLSGCRSVDQNFLTAAPRDNLALLLGLLGVWNNNFLNYHSRAIACYSEAMLKLAPHIQQVDMESNGKNVTLDGKTCNFATGEVNFGEPGTNSQHSFFQLFHQGQVVPVDFIGFVESQTPLMVEGDEVSNHDELMANFFAQPDALATGKTASELEAENVDPKVIPHRVFPGNRPSNVLLLPRLTAYEVGQILALYEHRTVVQGFVWGINSFDQFGVELGKKLADKVRNQFASTRKSGAEVKGFNPSTTHLLQRYVAGASAAASKSKL